MPVKRIVIVAALVLIVAAAGLMSLPFVISSKMIKDQLNTQIAELSGEQLTYKGEPHLLFNPFLGIELEQVSLKGNHQGEDEPKLLQVEMLQFGVRILPALFGKIKFTEFKLIRPRVNLIVRKDGSANWVLPSKLAKLAKLPISNNNLHKPVLGNAGTELADLSNITLGAFDIVDAIVEVRILNDETPIRISSLNAKLFWPSLGSSWDVSGNGIWRGERIAFSNFTQNPLALFRSGQSDVRVDLSSPSLALSFEGKALMVADIQLQGNTSISTPSLPRLFEMFVGEDKGSTPAIGDVKITGNVTANAREVRFNEAKLELDSNAASGNLQLYWNGENRPKISGTLAFSSLDISALVDGLLPVSELDGKPKNRAAVFPDNFFDLDMRFSAANYSIYDSNFANLAASAIIKEGEWLFEIGEADFFDGMVAATISSKTGSHKPEIEIKGVMRDIAMGAITHDLFGSQVVVSGKADVNFSLKSPGATGVKNFRDFSGSMDMKMVEGKIEGVDLIKAIAALKENNGFVGADTISGTTDFSDLSLNLLIYNGIGWITKGTAKGVEHNFRLSGKTDLISGGLAVTADVKKVGDQNGGVQSDRIFIGGIGASPLVMRSTSLKPRY